MAVPWPLNPATRGAPVHRFKSSNVSVRHAGTRRQPHPHAAFASQPVAVLGMEAHVQQGMDLGRSVNEVRDADVCCTRYYDRLMALSVSRASAREGLLPLRT